LRFEAAVRRELEGFLEAARRGDGVAGATSEERLLAEYVERLLEELLPPQCGILATENIPEYCCSRRDPKRWP